MKKIKIGIVSNASNVNYFLVLFFVFAGFSLHAQLFVPVTDDPFNVSLRFSPDSVVKLRIRTITCAFQYKPDGRIIEDKGLREYYEFDLLGRVKFYWRTRLRGMEAKAIEHEAVYRRGRKVKSEWTEYKYEYAYDTVFIYTYFDSTSQVATRRLCDGNYFHTWYYNYNDDGRISTQIHCRETNLGNTHRDFKLGVQTIISREDFRYETYSSTQVKKLCLNDEGKVYKETMMLLDVQGRMIDSREAYTAGGIRITVAYEYDSVGRMAAYTYTSNAGEQLNERTEYVYDSLGRIESVRRFKNTVLRDEFSYLYEAGASMSYAYINRRHIELGIDIVKLQIECFH